MHSGINGTMPAPVRIGACRALCKLCHKVAPEALQPQLPHLYEGLVLLLQESSEETLHLVLETLTAMLKIDKVVVVQVSTGNTPCWTCKANQSLACSTLKSLYMPMRLRLSSMLLFAVPRPDSTTSAQNLGGQCG